MKNSNSKTNLMAKLAKGLAKSELRQSSNSTTCGMIYQPKAPAALKKFSKIENDK